MSTRRHVKDTGVYVATWPQVGAYILVVPEGNRLPEAIQLDWGEDGLTLHLSKKKTEELQANLIDRDEGDDDGSSS